MEEMSKSFMKSKKKYLRRVFLETKYISAIFFSKRISKNQVFKQQHSSGRCKKREIVSTGTNPLYGIF